MEDKDCIIYLNVGGTKMATKKSTLCQVDGSLLASIFSGRWEDNITRDEDGHVFLDYNPKLFALVLDYLRAKKNETPGKPALPPPVSLDDTVNFRSLVDYLGIESNTGKINANDDMDACDNGIKQFSMHSEGIALKQNGTVAAHKPDTNCHEFVIGKDVFIADEYKNEVRWRFCLRSAQADSNLFVGVLDTRYRDSGVSESLTQRVNYTYTPPVYEWEGSYGWVLGENLKTCSNGHVLHPSTYGVLGKQGDTIELHLKTTKSDIFSSTKLSLHLHPTDVKRCISLPDSQSWQCVIGSYYAGDCIVLSS